MNERMPEEGAKEYSARIRQAAEDLWNSIPDQNVSESDLAMESSAISSMSPTEIAEALLAYKGKRIAFSDAKVLALARRAMDAFSR